MVYMSKEILKSIRYGKATEFECGCIQIVWDKETENKSKLSFYPCSEEHS